MKMLPSLLIILLFLICLSLPLKALAEVRQVNNTPTQHCGPACVIEPFMCDTKEEADKLFEQKKDYKRSAPYKLGDKWWVDVYMTEKEAELI